MRSPQGFDKIIRSFSLQLVTFYGIDEEVNRSEVKFYAFLYCSRRFVGKSVSTTLIFLSRINNGQFVQEKEVENDWKETRHETKRKVRRYYSQKKQTEREYEVSKIQGTFVEGESKMETACGKCHDIVVTRIRKKRF